MPVDYVQKLHHDIYPAIDPKRKLIGSANGKVIVITGAGKGIGDVRSYIDLTEIAIAKAFAAAGAKGLVLSSRTELDLERTTSLVKTINPETRVVNVVTDVSDKSSVENLFNEAFKKFSEIDILVNNAGVLEPGRLVAESDIDTWCRTWDVNVKGTFLPTRIFLMQPSFQGKTIINTTSVGALQTRPGLSGYQSSKTAIVRFTEFIDVEHGKQGLRAFAYHPGSIMADLASNLPTALHRVLIDTPELAGGYTVWLTTPTADFLKGRYSNATWDVDELTLKRSEIEKHNLLVCGITGLNAGAAQ